MLRMVCANARMCWQVLGQQRDIHVPMCLSTNVLRTASSDAYSSNYSKMAVATALQG
jgi:hypothetical protein